MLDKKMLILKAPRPDTIINVNICGGVFLSKKTTLLILFKFLPNFYFLNNLKRPPFFSSVNK